MIKPTWCPGCNNFAILAALKNVIKDEEKTAAVAGIGCHARIFDYLPFNGIHTIHGRVLPTCLGIKIGNPNLNVLGFSGDGDAYSEGMEHLIHAARYNSDIKYIVHNNQVFALTVGQSASTTEKGFKSKSSPSGNKMEPLNPIKLMLASGATFVARVSSDLKQIEYVLKEAMKHRGFAFIEILIPCLIFHNVNYKDKIYSLKESEHDKTNFDDAWKKAQEFDYDDAAPLGVPQIAECRGKKIPMGIFYQVEKEVFEDKFEQLKELKRKGIGWKDIRR